MIKSAVLLTTFAALTVITVAQARDRGSKTNSRVQRPRCRAEQVCRTEENCTAFSNVAQADGSLEITCSDTNVRKICSTQPVCE